MKETREQQLLQSFYKDYFSYGAYDIGLLLMAGILEFILGCFLLVPFQYMAADIKNIGFSLFCISFWGGFSYIQPYILYREEKKPCRVIDKLKLMPVSLKDIRLFLFRRLVRFQGRILPIFLVGQLLFAGVIYRKIIWENLCYPFMFGFVVPVVVNALVIRLAVPGFSDIKF